MSSNPAAPPSIARTGVKAGAAFMISVIKSVVLALALGGGVFFYYLGQLIRHGMPEMRADGVGVLMAFLTSPPVVVGLLLLAFVPLYVVLGVARARSRAVEQVAIAHGDTLAQRLGGAIAGRIEAMPRTHQTLQKASDWLNADVLSKQLAPVLGDSKVGRQAISMVLDRLPLPEIFAQWQQMRTEAGLGLGSGVEPATPRLATDVAASPDAAAAAQDPILRSLLAQRIGEALQDMAASSRTLFYYAFAAHAVVFGIGLWLTR
jgi:hypothetical protein